MYRVAVMVGDYIKAHTAQVPKCHFCSTVCLSDWWIFKVCVEHFAWGGAEWMWSIIREKKIGRLLAFPFSCCMDTAESRWESMWNVQAVRAHTLRNPRKHQDLLPKLKRQSMRRRSECVIVHVFAYGCECVCLCHVCVLVTELWFVALSNCPHIHQEEKWVLTLEWRGAVINLLANQ